MINISDIIVGNTYYIVLASNEVRPMIRPSKVLRIIDSNIGINNACLHTEDSLPHGASFITCYNLVRFSQTRFYSPREAIRDAILNHHKLLAELQTLETLH